MYSIDRIIRYIIGILMLTWAIAGGPGWAYVGFALIYTASMNRCPIYWLLRIPVKNS